MAVTDYYSSLGTVVPAVETPSTVEKILYRLDNGGAATAYDPVLLGYQAGDKLYSDPSLETEVTGTLQAKGKRLVENIPLSLTGPDSSTPDLAMTWAISVSSFHSVTGHPGGGNVLPFQLETAGTMAAPAAGDYALHDATLGRQVFVDNTVATEQITVEPLPESYQWLRMRRTDPVGGPVAAAAIAGSIVVVREVK